MNKEKEKEVEVEEEDEVEVEKDEDSSFVSHRFDSGLSPPARSGVPKNADFDAKNIQRTLFQFIIYSRLSIFKHSFLDIRKVATFLVFR